MASWSFPLGLPPDHRLPKHDLDSPSRIDIGISNAAKFYLPIYQTEQISSPPTFAFLASRSTRCPSGSRHVDAALCESARFLVDPDVEPLAPDGELFSV